MVALGQMHRAVQVGRGAVMNLAQTRVAATGAIEVLVASQVAHQLSHVPVWQTLGTTAGGLRTIMLLPHTM